MSATVDATLSVLAQNHLENRTADADIGNKTETTLIEVVSAIFGGTVVFGKELKTVISRLLFLCRLKVREMTLKQVHKFTSHHSDPGMSGHTKITTRNKDEQRKRTLIK